MDCRTRFHFEPLRIVAQLGSNIIADRWLPLDGLLLYQICRAQWGAQALTMPGGDTTYEANTLPVEIINPGRADWYYACSWAQPQPWWVGEGQDHWNKRFDLGFATLIDFSGRRGKIIIEKGKYKAYHMPLFYYIADYVEWYCIADKKEVESLLSTALYLGKKGAQGWGRVRRWIVEAWPVDWSVWRAGCLTRGIPPQDEFGLDLVLYGLRPPYYRAENQMLLRIPK